MVAIDTSTLQSVTFDPFMYLSVPIPVRNEKMVAVVMLPRIRTRYVVGSTSTGLSAQEAASGERRSVAVLCCAVKTSVRHGSAIHCRSCGGACVVLVLCASE